MTALCYIYLHLGRIAWTGRRNQRMKQAVCSKVIIMHCPSCGTENPTDNRFCISCGAPLARPASTPSPIPAPNSSGAMTSIQTSLGRLGIEVSTRQLVGIAVATIVGIVVARVLPNIYPIIFAPILAVLFFGNGSGTSDSFNSSMMTWITFLSAFAVSLLIGRKK
jgi:hypothetical protein